ncbi:MAG: hypothetical protein NZ528_02000 [Caldilineales bacterium]|nr:hypothetical protein [Caldilineales bacterium]MDW8317066.1 V-type ATPase 116kDa subunit family protein [Anaerolineae bacterium]
MIVPMAKVQIIGHLRCLDETLQQLYQLRLVHIIEHGPQAGAALRTATLGAERLKEQETLRYLRARLEAVLQLLPPRAGPAQPAEPPTVFSAEEIEALRAEIETITPRLEALVQQMDALRQEQATLPRYAQSIQRLLPLVPTLAQPQRFETVALLLNRRHARVLELLSEDLTALMGQRFVITSAPVDGDTLGAVLVFPRRYSAQVHALLGRERVSEVRLPPSLADMPLSRALATIEQRLHQIPAELAAAEAELDALTAPHRERWAAASRYIADRLNQLNAVRLLGATEHTFVLVGWVPRQEVPRLQALLAERVGPAVVCHELPLSEEDRSQAPVLLQNPPPARPYEFLVRLLSLPRYGTIDPTLLMSLFLPLFFGITLGDVAYGLALIGIALLLRRRLGGSSATWRDLSHVLLMGGAWSVVFGFVYGELLGNLGHQLGMHPLWLNREEALQPLLLFSVAIGVGHVTLGLLLGVWVAWRERHRHALLEKVGLLVALMGLFLMAAQVIGRLPRGFFTPGLAALVVGLVLLIRSMGALGLLMAPLEVLSTVGNMLSYLRIAAIGLSSVYLARVANEMVGALGPLWLGVLVAVFFHALNVALGAFSPTIHSLRLHYVEFFGKFYQEGGRPYEPFGAASP